MVDFTHIIDQQAKPFEPTKEALAGSGDPLDAQQGETPPEIIPTPHVLRLASEIPLRQWLYDNHLIRGFVSATVAQGGLGKSSLVLTEAVSMVSARALLEAMPPKPLRVWYWNGEDPAEEIERRVAAICLHYGIRPEDIGDRFMTDSGRAVPIKLAETDQKGRVRIAKPTVAALVQAIQAAEIDVLIIDPFVTSHAVSENDNHAINAVISEWRHIADVTGCAIELVHHVSKAGAMGGDDFGIMAARGAVALIDGVRSARHCVRMTNDLAEKFNIEDDWRQYFAVHMGKANLAPPEKAVWRKMVGVPLHNGRDLWPGGDWVGVCTPWTPPDAFDGMTADDLKRVQSAITTMDEPPAENERSDTWAGYVVADAMGWDVGRGLKKADRTTGQNGARAKVRRMLSEWVRSKALAVDFVRSTRDGREVKVVVVGEPVQPDVTL